MVSRQPTLRDAVTPLTTNISIADRDSERGRTYVLNYVTVITNEQEGAVFWEIDLHAYQAVCVSWQVVKGDALAEVEGALIECLPVANLVQSRT